MDRHIPGHKPDEEGPITKELKSYGVNGRVFIPVVGAFAEMSTDAHAIADFALSPSRPILRQSHASTVSSQRYVQTTYLPDLGDENASELGSTSS